MNAVFILNIVHNIIHKIEIKFKNFYLQISIFKLRNFQILVQNRLIYF